MQLKLFVCTDHDMHYPVGGCSIILAESEEAAKFMHRTAVIGVKSCLNLKEAVKWAAEKYKTEGKVTIHNGAGDPIISVCNFEMFGRSVLDISIQMDDVLTFEELLKDN